MNGGKQGLDSEMVPAEVFWRAPGLADRLRV